MEVRSTEVCAAQEHGAREEGEGKSIDPSSIAIRDEADTRQCQAIFTAQHDRGWTWTRMADEIERLAGCRVQNPIGLTHDQAAAVLASLAADGINGP